MVGVDSALGFLISAPAVIAARAFMHTFVGLAGAVLLKKGISFKWVVIILAPLPGLLEAIAYGLVEDLSRSMHRDFERIREEI